jgi:hypothetical protein
MVSMPGLPSVSEQVYENWQDTLRRLVDNLYAVDAAGAALRVVFDPQSGTQHALLVAVNESGSTPLRRFLAPFTRLDTVISNSARLPLARAEYDAIMDEFPPLRCLASVLGYEAGEVWFACDFRIGPSLESMILEAESYGYRLGYHVNVRSLEVDQMRVRLARLNALSVSELPGVSEAASSLQFELSRQLADSVAICQEYLGVDPGEPTRWLQAALERQFRARFGSLRFETPDWVLVDRGYEEDLACPALLAPESMTAADLCSSAVTEPEVTKLLSWNTPHAHGARTVERPAPESAEPDIPPEVSELPPRAAADEPFLFISYRRSDLERIIPIVQELQEEGWRVWYDAGIPGGADWNAMLEERLESCSGVLLFLSQSAVDSKWVRREVHFADSLDKPIIGVQLEQAELRHGMRLLLEHYQLLSKDAGDFFGELNKSLFLLVPMSLGRSPSS